jgi:hypothetical protein
MLLDIITENRFKFFYRLQTSLQAGFKSAKATSTEGKLSLITFSTYNGLLR